MDMHDVVIIGAGPGGSSAAWHLAKNGLKVLLLDKFEFPRDKTCGDGLTPRAIYILKEMGVLEQLSQPIHSVPEVALVAPNGQSMDFSLTNDCTTNNQIMVIPRLTLDASILRNAEAAGAQFCGGTQVTNVVHKNEGLCVNVEEKGQSYQVEARAVIIATGANTKLLTTMGLLAKQPTTALATRAYFDNIQDLPNILQLHLFSKPQPGYGWIFPMSATKANVGAGVFPMPSWTRVATVKGSRASFDAFLKTPIVRQLLEGAEIVGPIKGYPIRTDFGQHPTYADGILLVGEAAGLVNPLTGDGIDYALESGKIAANQLTAAFEKGDFSSQFLQEYDRTLRQKYHRLFAFCNRLRYLHLNPAMLNWFLSRGNKRPDIKEMIIDSMLGNREMFTTLEIAKAIVRKQS